MDKDKWIKRWKSWLAPTRVPGVWKRKEGGHLVRARVTEPTTGTLKKIKRVLPKADLATAYKWLEDEKARVRAGVDLEKLPQAALRRLRDLAARAQNPDGGHP